MSICFCACHLSIVCHKNKNIFFPVRVWMKSLLLHLSIAYFFFFSFRSFVLCQLFSFFVQSSSHWKQHTQHGTYETRLNDNFIWGFQFSQHNKWSVHWMGKYHNFGFVENEWHTFYHNFSAVSTPSPSSILLSTHPFINNFNDQSSICNMLVHIAYTNAVFCCVVLGSLGMERFRTQFRISKITSYKHGVTSKTSTLAHCECVRCVFGRCTEGANIVNCNNVRCEIEVYKGNDECSQCNWEFYF